MHPTQKTIDMLRNAVERINKLTRTTRKQFEDEIFNPPLARKVKVAKDVQEPTNQVTIPGADKTQYQKRGSVKPKGNKIRKHPGDHDQRVHSPTGREAMTRERATGRKGEAKGLGIGYKARLSIMMGAAKRGMIHTTGQAGVVLVNRATNDFKAGKISREQYTAVYHQSKSALRLATRRHKDYKSRLAGKVMKRKVGKHAMGQHDQSTHGRRNGSAEERYTSQFRPQPAPKPRERAPRISNNRQAESFIDNEKPFKGNNIYAERNQHGDYAVYSYGSHFPMYAKIKGQWYGNKDKYSPTTSRHQNIARPSGKIRYMTTEKLKRIIDRYKKLQRMAKGDIIKHPGHPDQSVHGRRGVYARAAGAGAAGAVAGRALAPAVRGLAATAAAGRAVSALSRTVQRINPKGVKKFKRLKRRATRALRRHTAKLGRAIAPAAKAGLRLASRVRVPGVIGVGLMAAAAGIGLVVQRTRKMQKAGGLTAGDHVLVLTGDEAIVGVYAGNETVRVLTNDSYVDTKPPKADVLLIERGNTVPDENSSSDEIATLADTLSREKKVMENLSGKVKNGKVSKRVVDKHTPGGKQHDQKTHAPKGRGGSSRGVSVGGYDVARVRTQRPKIISGEFTGPQGDGGSLEVPAGSSHSRSAVGSPEESYRVDTFIMPDKTVAIKVEDEGSNAHFISFYSNLKVGRKAIAAAHAGRFKDMPGSDDIPDKYRRKVSKRSVDKHAMGQHDQKTHGNRATRAVRAVRAKARRVGRRVQSGIRQAGRTIEATTQTTRQVADDLDSVLQGLEAGTRIYDKVKSLKDSLLGESEKMMKAKMSDKELAQSKRLAERMKGKEGIDNPHALARWQVQRKLAKLEQTINAVMSKQVMAPPRPHLPAPRPISIPRGVHTSRPTTPKPKWRTRGGGGLLRRPGSPREAEGPEGGAFGLARRWKARQIRERRARGGSYIDPAYMRRGSKKTPQKSVSKQAKKPKRYSPPKSLRSSPSFMITPGVFGASAKPKTLPLKPGGARTRPRRPGRRIAPKPRTMPIISRRKPRMTKKFADVQAAFEKGIGHSLRTLTNALDLIREQEADKKISEADEKRLQEVIREIRSMVGYLQEVKEQGFFEKGEAAVPDSTTTYRPSFTTPAVADHFKRQGIKPNAKGRGESTARAPGY